MQSLNTHHVESQTQQTEARIDQCIQWQNTQEPPELAEKVKLYKSWKWT